MCQDDISHALSNRIFSYLTNVQEWAELGQYCSADYEVVYLKGKPHRDADVKVIIPIKNSRDIEWKRMDYYFRIFNVKVIAMAFSEGDSTLVFYDMQKGLHPPPSMEIHHEDNKKLGPECEL